METLSFIENGVVAYLKAAQRGDYSAEDGALSYVARLLDYGYLTPADEAQVFRALVRFRPLYPES
jgi:hypothetical protein